jgi:hypothetical protein
VRQTPISRSWSSGIAPEVQNLVLALIATSAHASASCTVNSPSGSDFLFISGSSVSASISWTSGTPHVWDEADADGDLVSNHCSDGWWDWYVNPITTTMHA